MELKFDDFEDLILQMRTKASNGENRIDFQID
jgi:hypothetical protein